MSTSALPNIVVVMMDTVRQSDFPGGVRGVDGMPNVAALRKESVVYPRTVSPANWTVPSHASVLTGLYHWEHGANGRGDIRLSSTIPQLPERLRPHGYRSLTLASNFLVGPETGMGTTADLACWGTWWESYLRGIPLTQPPNLRRASDPSGAPPPSRPREGAFWRLVRGVAPVVHRYPGLMDVASHAMRWTRPPPDGLPDGVSPWIEPYFESWLGGLPKEAPAFALINLLDAHEPYLPPAGSDMGLEGWLRCATVPQDRTGWLGGRWELDEKHMATLRALYRESIRALDRRVAGIISALRATGRWENTMFVLTSDHGQALGEQGLFYHMLRVDEAEVRIPLWVRYPHGERGGETARGWASLIDIAPTALDLAGDPGLPYGAAVSLKQLLAQERPQPVLSANDGLLWDPMARGVSGARRAELDRPWVAAYSGRWKVIHDVEANQSFVIDIDADPDEHRPQALDGQVELAPLAESAREVGTHVGRVPTSAGGNGPEGPVPSDVEDRLRSWGYL